MSSQADLLRGALAAHGREVPEEALRAVLARWRAPEEEGQPLAALTDALRGHGVTLPAQAAAQVAWTLLGVERPRALRLGPGGPTRLTHLVEWHDVALPSSARALGRQLRREPTLAPDLLAARPGLAGADLPAGDVLEAVFGTEWSGFLALLGEFGPWVYVPSVADLQALSRRYAALVSLAAGGRDPDLIAAARELAWGEEASPRAPALLTRLEATDHRPPAPEGGLVHADPAAVARLVEAEATFWAAARALAERRRVEWGARRGGR